MTTDELADELTVGEPGPSLLEARYRRWLRVLPAGYRAQWEEEMVATFLATAGAEDDPDFLDYGRPPVGEVASVLGLAVRLRLGGMPTQGSQECGGAARYVALAGMLASGVAGLVGLEPLLLMLRTWSLGELDPTDPTGVVLAPLSDPAALLNWVRVLAQLLAALWFVAYFALVTGHHRLARRVGALAFLPAVAVVVLDLVAQVTGFEESRIGLTRLSFLLLTALPLAAAVAFRDDTPPVPPHPWLRAGTAGLLLASVLVLAPWLWYPDVPVIGFVILDQLTLSTVALVVAAVVASRRALADRRAWWLALLVLAVAVFLTRLVAVVEGGTLTVLGEPFRHLLWVRGGELLALAGFVAWHLAALRRTAPRRRPLPQS